MILEIVALLVSVAALGVSALAYVSGKRNAQRSAAAAERAVDLQAASRHDQLQPRIDIEWHEELRDGAGWGWPGVVVTNRGPLDYMDVTVELLAPPQGQRELVQSIRCVETQYSGSRQPDGHFPPLPLRELPRGNTKQLVFQFPVRVGEPTPVGECTLLFVCRADRYEEPWHVQASVPFGPSLSDSCEGH